MNTRMRILTRRCNFILVIVRRNLLLPSRKRYWLFSRAPRRMPSGATPLAPRTKPMLRLWSSLPPFRIVRSLLISWDQLGSLRAAEKMGRAPCVRTCLANGIMPRIARAWMFPTGHFAKFGPRRNGDSGARQRQPRGPSYRTMEVPECFTETLDRCFRAICPLAKFTLRVLLARTFRPWGRRRMLSCRVAGRRCCM